MKLQLEYLSDHLKSTRNMFAGFRHGGVILADEELETVIERFNDFISMARKLECELSRREWNARAQQDCRDLVDDHSAAVLEAMRAPGSNVISVRFPGTVRRFPKGGDVA